MLYNIDEMIKSTATMDNISDGGSACYNFGDVILVKYITLEKYGIARKDEEKIFDIANMKNIQGVNTPKHLMIKREVVDGHDICWVMQEKAKGECYANFCRNKNPEIQLENQSKLAELDNIHYEKLASDLKELMYAGIELQPKNIFLDTKNLNGGFTIIDLLTPKNKVYQGTLQENSTLFKYLKIIFEHSKLLSYVGKPTDEQIAKSEEVSKKQYLKCFKALNKSVPEFNYYNRWILRSLDEDTLKYFKNNGFDYENLTLTAKEEKQFKDLCLEIKNNSIKKIKEGTHKFWQIEVNEVRIDIDCNLLIDAYNYSPKSKIDKGMFENQYDYRCAVSDFLKNRILNLIKKEIETLVKTGKANDNILQAYRDMNPIDKSL